MKPTTIYLWLLAASLFALPLQAQTIRYVTTSGSNTTPETATSWATSTTDLQGAIEASAAGDQVWVATGTYKPGGATNIDPNISFSMKADVAIYGGFVGTEQVLSDRPVINPVSGMPNAARPSSTTLSGDIGTSGDNADNSYHVIYNGANLTASARLDGFVITGGTGFGGGMFNSSCSPTLANCLFQGNSSSGDGGGMYNISGSNPVLTNCSFQGNSATQFGGGMANDNSRPSLINCSFQGNSADNGGGMYNFFDCNPVLANCSFQGNSANGSGGGMFNFLNCNPVLTNCSFQGNSADNGGGMYNLSDCTAVLTNCSFQGNSANGSGGGIDNEFNSNMSLLNCVLFGNGGSNTFVNNDGSSIAVRYSLLEASVSGYSDGGNNLTTTTSPFASTTATQLAGNASAINAGSNQAYSNAGGPATDLAGNPRIFPTGGQIDMGAYEYICPTRLYVKANATGANTGLDWTNAFTHLQSALNYACLANLSEIWVASGTYKPTAGGDRSISFVMKNGVAIYGGFVGTEQTLSDRPASFPSPSILSGDIGIVGNNTDNSYHVLTQTNLTASARLDGFVIQGGNANGSFPHDRGAGSYTDHASPQFVNCVFQNNSGVYGGAMAIDGTTSSATPRLTNCLFMGNSASNQGGALYNYGSSGGNASPVLVNCSFQANTATNGGGGLYNNGAGGTSSPSLTNCSFQGNSTAGNGGAMFSEAGGGTSSPVLTNCVVYGNGGSNSFYSYLSNVSVRYSLVEASATEYSDGGNNVLTSVSPFASTTATPLAVCSPGVNAGSNGAYSTAGGPATDLAGNPRIFPSGGTGTPAAIDMGAYEQQTSPQMPARLYVKANATGTNTGLDWTNAFTDLQSALNYACSGNLTEIWVATGMYKPTSSNDRNLSFVMKAGVAIYGGFVGSELSLSARPALNPVSSPGVVSQPSSSTLSGDIGTIGDAGDNSYHVINNGASLSLTASARLDGFVITGGNGNGTGNGQSSGGGMYNASSSPTLANCSFVGNLANTGGGMYNTTSSNPVMTNCLFQGSSSSGFGGGMFNDSSSPVLTNCSLVSNSGEQGGGMSNTTNSSPVLTNCSFVSNSGGYGGGMYNLNSSNPLLANCSFQSNTANIQGGGMYNRGSSNPSLTNCSFQSNTASNAGGGMSNQYSNPVLTNCSFHGNSADLGGAMTSFQSSARLVNCVLFGNGGSNTFYIIEGSTLTVRYSLLEGSGSDDGEGNKTTTTSPFASTTSTQLSACSPAINAGSNAAYTALTNPPATDLAGNPRFFNGGVIDMGAYEFQATPQSPARLYVKANATGANTGLDWTNAFPDLQSALNYACSGNLSEIWVATGTYKPTSGTDRSLSFVMKAGVAIYGGFLGTEQVLSARPAINPVTGPGGVSQPSSSTLSGDIGTIGDAGDNSYHVINNGASLSLTASARLDGFVITGGNGNVSGQNQGGGMVNDNSSPTLVNCLFVANLAVNGGGGISNTTNSSPSLTNCSFVSNSGEEGGGMSNRDNSSPVLTNCSFQGNSGGTGGGMHNRASSNPSLTNCSFVSNSAVQGGGMFNNISSPVLTNCSFQGNSAAGAGNQFIGGGMANGNNSNPVLTNCSFQGNSAQYGGGIFTYVRSNPVLTNCVVFGNGAGNTFAQDESNNSTLTVRYSLLEASVSGYGGDNNRTTTTSPFASTTSTQLSACSPAINAGSSAAYTALTNPPATDLAGNPRFFNGGIIDMGAYEYQGTPTSLPVSNPAITSATLNQPFSQSFTASGGSAPYSFSQASGSLPTGLTLTATGQLSGTPTQTGSFTITVNVQDAAGCSGSGAPYVLTVSNAIPTIGTFAANPASVCVGSPVTFTASIGNVTGSYGYTLTNGATTTTGSSSATTFTQSLTVGQSGPQTYTLLVSSGSQSASATAPLAVNAFPIATLSASPSTTLSCAQTSLTLTASGGSSYTFTSSNGVVGTPGVSPTLVVSSAGTYSVAVASASGCVSTTSISISSATAPPSLSVSPVSATLTCASPLVSLSAVGVGTYRWSTGATSSVISATSANTYSVTLTGTNGCTATASAQVFQSTTPPTVSINPASATLTCASPSVSLTAVGIGTYRWSTGATSPIISATSAGTYSVTLTGTNGCTAATSAQVFQDNFPPTVSITPSSATLTCTTPTVSLSVVGTGSVLWSTGETTRSISVSLAGDYSVALTAPNGCQSVTTVTVSQDKTAPSVSISPASATLTCASPMISLSAIGSGTYRWSTGATSPTISATAAGIYSVTLTGANGCTASATSQVIQDNAVPTVSINPSSATLSCSSPTASLTAVGNGTYRWSTGATTSIISATSVGTYSVTLTGANGCTASASASVSYQNCAPTVANAIPSQTATVGQVFSYTIPANTFTDAETPTNLTLTVTGLPVGLSFVAPATITGTPSTTLGSPFSLTVTATDSGGLSARTTFILSINSGATPNSFTITNVTLLNCDNLTYYSRRIDFSTSYSGTNGQPISVSVVNELTATTYTGPYSLTVYTDNPVIVVRARQQGTVGEATYSFRWLDGCFNGPPMVANAIPPQSATLGQAFSYAIPANTFTDAETPTSLTISVVGLPAGLSLVSPGTITGTPSATASPFYSVTVIATDPGGQSVSTILPLSVVNPGGCLSMYTVKAGEWSDASVWSCGRVPVSSDAVTLNHAVSLPASYQGQALRLIYGATGRLLLGSGSGLRLGGN